MNEKYKGEWTKSFFTSFFHYSCFSSPWFPLYPEEIQLLSMQPRVNKSGIAGFEDNVHKTELSTMYELSYLPTKSSVTGHTVHLCLPIALSLLHPRWF